MVASADILKTIEKVDLAAANMPIDIEGDAAHLANRGIIEGIRLATQLKTTEGNLGDALGSSAAELWQEEGRSNEERLAIVTGLFLGALVAHEMEITA